jgi:hypothetical protein
MMKKNMKKNAATLLHSEDLITANQNMIAEQLLFFPEEEQSQQRLCHYLKEHYDLDFTYQNTTYDKDLIFGATPNLGPQQLGVYATRSFEEGEILGEIKGTNLFGIRSNAEIKKLVKEYQGNSSYVWQLNLDKHDKYAVVIDLLNSGTSTRWINHSEEPNVTVRVDYKKRKDNNGKEYFTVEHPRILRKIPNLIRVLRDLAKSKNLPMATNEINNREDIKDFFNSLTQELDMLRKEELKKANLAEEEFKKVCT